MGSPGGALGDTRSTDQRRQDLPLRITQSKGLHGTLSNPWLFCFLHRPQTSSSKVLIKDDLRQAALVAHDEDEKLIRARQVYRSYVPRPEFEEWEDWPEGLYLTLRRIRDEYGNPPVYITESGTTSLDAVSADGCVHDPVRVDYLRRHFAAVHQALVEGADVRGYFVWSLIDNFEWGFGRTKRFGIVYTDYGNDLRRIPKDSAHFYAGVIDKNGFTVQSRGSAIPDTGRPG